MYLLLALASHALANLSSIKPVLSDAACSLVPILDAKQAQKSIGKSCRVRLDGIEVGLPPDSFVKTEKAWWAELPRGSNFWIFSVICLVLRR